MALEQFRNPKDAYNRARSLGYTVIAAEDTNNSIPLSVFVPRNYDLHGPCAVVVGNEVDGVLPETCDEANYRVIIPMLGHK